MFLPIVNKLREITIMWQYLLTEEQILPLTEGVDLASRVKREGHMYSCDRGFSVLHYSHPRFLLTLILYAPQTELCSLCRKRTPKFRLLFFTMNCWTSCQISHSRTQQSLRIVVELILWSLDFMVSEKDVVWLQSGRQGLSNFSRK